MTILVAGATGNIGRLLVDELAGQDEPVRALTIDPAKAALPDDVEVFRGHLGRPETARPALDGADKVYLPPKFETASEIAALAKKVGVRHAVVLSSILSTNSEAVAADEYARSFVDLERTVVDAGLDWTFLCPGAFMENTFGWAESVRAESVVRAPFPNATDTAIAMADIATMAAAVLTGEGHEGRRYRLSGPEALTVPQQVTAIGDALGREVRYEELTREQAKQKMLGEGIDDETAEWLLAGGDDMRMTPEQDFTEATGKPATTYADWARRNAEQFR